MTSRSTIPERVAEMHATLAAQPPSEAMGAFAREQAELVAGVAPRQEGASRRGPGRRARCGHQAGYMEPPGKYGGPALALHDYRHDEMFFDVEMLSALGLDPSLASKGYLATIRFGHCVIGLLRVGRAELLPLQALASPRQWVPIWPAIGTSQ